MKGWLEERKGRKKLTTTKASTPGLKTSGNVNLKPYVKNRPDAPSSSSRNQGIVSSELLLQSSEHPKLDFVGRESNEDADSQLKHYVAVLDAEKKTWEFVEVRRMVVRGAVRTLKPVDEEESESEDEMAVCSLLEWLFYNTHFPTCQKKKRKKKKKRKERKKTNDVEKCPRSTHRTHQHLRHQTIPQSGSVYG